MSLDLEKGRDLAYKMPLSLWVVLAFIGCVIVIPYFDGIKALLKIWESKEEYSYGYMVPFVCLFFIWQKNESLEKIEFDGSWAGASLALFGVILYIVGELSTLYLLIQYSMLIVIFGLALSFMGWKAFRIILVPLIILMFMIPLPQFFLQEI